MSTTYFVPFSIGLFSPIKNPFSIIVLLWGLLITAERVAVNDVISVASPLIERFSGRGIIVKTISSERRNEAMSKNCTSDCPLNIP